MKIATVFLPLLAATLVSSRSLFGGFQSAIVDENEFEVPGKNPLHVCLAGRCPGPS